MVTIKKLALAGMTAMATAGSWASPTTVWSETLSPGGVVSAAALQARSTLQSHLASNVQSFGFESSLLGVGDTAPLDVDFAGSGSSVIRATLTGSGSLARSNGGRFDTTLGGSGLFWQTRAGGTGATAVASQEFSINFNTGVAGFGFYATDAGDFDGALSLVLTPSSGGADVTLSLRNTTGQPANGNLIFFGFYDLTQTYSKITFITSGATSSTDYFGFDDFMVADAGQVLSTTPEPGSLALVGLALLGAGGALRKRKAA